MQIHYAGKVSKAEFVKAVFTHSNKQYRVHKWVVSIVLGMFAFSTLYLAIQGSPEVAQVFKYAFPGALIPLGAMTFPWWAPYLQLSAYDQKGNIYRNNVFGLIDDAGFTIKSTDVNVSFQWSAFENCILSNDLFMLYQSKNCFNIFTPSMFSNQDEWEKFVSLAKEKVSVNKKSA
jgi:hypothetical protein